MAAGYERDGYGGYEDSYDERPDDAHPPDYVPDYVKSFVGYLYRSIREKNVYEVHQMYESSFSKLSERFFSKSHWPSAELVAPYVDNDHVFCLLYKEMYYRHVYAKLNVTFQERLESWDNYCNLFTVILHGNVNMQLPNQWLWDMVDEFIYQFQAFCQYRTKLKNKTEQELSWLKQYDEQVWNVYGVANFLQALIDKSEILQVLEEEKDGAVTAFSANDGYDYEGGSNVLKVLGYFSIIGLARVHCLLGDYHTALKRLAHIDLTQHGVYSSVIGCHITAAYYYGFSNMMMLRYIDAIKTFNQVLVYISKTRQYHQKSSQFEWILKKNEQMYALLAICLWFCPQWHLVESENARSDSQRNETVTHQLKEKRGEKLSKMHKNDEAAFDECFSYACPKFISPSLPDLSDTSGNYSQEAYRLQLKLFLSEVRQQQLLNKIRNYVKLYTTISIAKLASLVEVDEATLRMALMTYKHKTHYIDDDGSVASTADVEFYIDEDVVHIAEPKVTKRFSEIFVRHILKFDELVGDLERVALE
ncbi:hypothetical protein SELMODRAFT_146079 [Selaginella moellendorffii]|uniref:Eukaryotic translation initiation factor 3 subunit L n=1 Tax=Selaginella moellendorffii TaxID=88036 RepID=D8RD49_SELML|nr:eukaryotic translation initiation factor 3 subunit L [Selaginella moellendorffii]XP_024529552.1 eukaryotic translation initiation factor 3 subunit L [Selaginella moellendorffii]EFJ25086.1 hypothetical protein SELMODRAFT_149527 [Selaginella moellendorffii]EFJ29958.1 hypothetical protein SELMODRAFT_146079 [Selaginella moellendorffii]|eukprot:XP_002974131.1 eukaryotic translation initiation factor 3 subunit L [Selaginella moellendorffii]